LLGIDVRQYNIVAVKSAQHFKAYFKHLADHIISVDPPGISSGNLHQLPLKHIKHPIYPLDETEM
ncbi:MAG TPA: MlrC C-terminal domain-containing protein, partial [Candidatus Dorea faecipullorum]|nr:MlrC C-terminal domain-containing protein [Candidatus Dorea faecipullorum]